MSDEQLDLYPEIRKCIRMGDMIGMSDNSLVARATRWATKGDISHVGMVYRASRVKRDMVLLVEAEKSGMLSGMIDFSRLSRRVMDYSKSGGRVWWFPLSKNSRRKFDAEAFRSECLRHDGVAYSLKQALMSVLAVRSNPVSHRLICSSSVALAYKEAGILPTDLNHSEATPQDLVRAKLWKKCVQIVGTPLGRDPEGFNSIDPKALEVD